MKKSILIKVLYFFCVMLFTACSNDDGNDNTTSKETPILIKKITETVYYSGTSETTTADFEYENNVLVRILSGNRKGEFVYDDEKITKINNFKDGILDGYSSYYYEGDLLRYVLTGENQDEKTEFLYENGVLLSEKSGYLAGSDFVVLDKKSYVFNESKNMTQSIEISSFFGPETTSKEIYSYDNKNNPMKYMNKYYRIMFGIEGFDGKTANNVISRESYYPVTTENPNYYDYEMVYNSDNFPTEIKKIARLNKTLISKTSIEYQ